MTQGQAPPVEHPVTAAVQVVRDGLAALRGATVWSLSDDDLITALDDVAAAEAELAAVRLALVAGVDGRNLAALEATTTTGWLRGRLLLAPGAAKRTVKLALALREDSIATGAALASGACSEEQAAVVAPAGHRDRHG